MSSVLYRQCKKSIYNNIRTHRNTALNHSTQTISKFTTIPPSLITIVTKGTIDSLIHLLLIAILFRQLKIKKFTEILQKKDVMLKRKVRSRTFSL